MLLLFPWRWSSQDSSWRPWVWPGSGRTGWQSPPPPAHSCWVSITDFISEEKLTQESPQQGVEEAEEWRQSCCGGMTLSWAYQPCVTPPRHPWTYKNKLDFIVSAQLVKLLIFWNRNNSNWTWLDPWAWFHCNVTITARHEGIKSSNEPIDVGIVRSTRSSPDLDTAAGSPHHDSWEVSLLPSIHGEFLGKSYLFTINASLNETETFSIFSDVHNVRKHLFSH